MENLSDGKLQAIVINSGVANACMGQQGLEDAKVWQKLQQRL